MKKRLILSSFILSLFLLLFSCGIPNWFYINSYNVSNSTTNKTTTFSINSEFELDISFFLVYSIHNEDVETSTIRSGLLNRFIKEYNANNTNNPNGIPLRNSKLVEYTYNDNLFSLYPFSVIEPDGILNFGNSPIFSVHKNKGQNHLEFQINYDLKVDSNDGRYLSITSSENLTEYKLFRYNRTPIEYNQDIDDTDDDVTNAGPSNYTIYILPVFYISSSDSNDLGPYNNTWLIVPTGSSSMLSYNL